MMLLNSWPFNRKKMSENIIRIENGRTHSIMTPTRNGKTSIIGRIDKKEHWQSFKVVIHSKIYIKTDVKNRIQGDTLENKSHSFNEYSQGTVRIPVKFQFQKISSYNF